MDLLEIILAIVSGVLGISGGAVGLYIRKIRSTIKELVELLIVVQSAIKDDNITPEEARQIAEEAIDLVEVWRK